MHMRMLGANALDKRREGLLRDLHRHIASRAIERGEQDADLLGRTGAEFDDLRLRSDQPREFGRMALEKRKLGPREVILRKRANLLEKAPAGRIVEIFAGDALGFGRKPHDQRVREIDVGWRPATWRQSAAACEGHASSASLMPENCQRAAGGKKFR